MMHTQLKDDLRAAMKERDETKKEVLRSVLSAFTNELVATNKKPDEKLTDEEANTVLTRLAKQRKDSIEQYKNGGRDDLAQNESKELEVLEEYLPEQMSEDEIKKVVAQKKEALAISDPSEKGKLMGAVMQDLKGKADGTMVKTAVDSSFDTES